MLEVDIEPAELQEVVEVVTTTKLITKVVTTASATITAAALKLTTAAAPTITTAPTKSKDKGKGILVEEPKPVKMQAQIKQDEAYARELQAELNKNIDWDKVIDHVQRKQKEKNAMKRYQALMRKPQTEAQARKNMMIDMKRIRSKRDKSEQNQAKTGSVAKPGKSKVVVVDRERKNEENKKRMVKNANTVEKLLKF
nr:hypothetical protein [Tanacetum cinerariifolium]